MPSSPQATGVLPSLHPSPLATGLADPPTASCPGRGLQQLVVVRRGTGNTRPAGSAHCTQGNEAWWSTERWFLSFPPPLHLLWWSMMLSGSVCRHKLYMTSRQRRLLSISKNCLMTKQLDPIVYLLHRLQNCILLFIVSINFAFSSTSRWCVCSVRVHADFSGDTKRQVGLQFDYWAEGKSDISSLNPLFSLHQMQWLTGRETLDPSISLVINRKLISQWWVPTVIMLCLWPSFNTEGFYCMWVQSPHG